MDPKTKLDMDLHSLSSTAEKWFEEEVRKTPKLAMPASFPTPEEVREWSETYAADIFSAWTMLTIILTRHEAVLRKRWMKKDKKQRKAILLAAWPNMPERHRPDLHELEKAEDRRRINLQSQLNEESFKYPLINQEDLLEGRTLLLLLNARGRHPPHVFAHADFDMTHLARAAKFLTLPFLKMHTMYLSGESTVENYGRLVSWRDDPSACAMMQKSLQFAPGDGVMVMGIQSRIYSFLLDCCYRIFHDIPRDELVSLSLPEQPEPPQMVDSETSYARLSSVAADAPYMIPAALDTHRLILLIDAKRAAAEDYVWALREDPGYFATKVAEYAEHRVETLLDRHGRRHPEDGTELFWNQNLIKVVWDAYIMFFAWDWFYNRVVILHDVVDAAGPLDHSKPLPEKLETALIDLGLAAEEVSEFIVSALRNCVVTSPIGREQYFREPYVPGAMIQTNSKKLIRKDTLLFLFRSLLQQESHLLWERPHIVDRLQRCVDRDPGQKARMSSLVEGYFGDLALVCQLIKSVRNFYPWAAGWAEQMSSRTRPGSIWGGKYVLDLCEASKDEVAPNIARIVVPVQRNLHYPIEKAPNATNANACRDAESRLDRLWDVTDAHFEKHAGRTLHEEFLSRGAKAREIYRTPEWTPPPPKVSQSSAKGKEDKRLTDAFSKLDVEPDRPGRYQGPEATRAPKYKTRCASKASESPDISPPLPPVPSESSPPATPRFPTFTLPRRAHKVFGALFPNSSNPSQGGEVKWSEFLHAMTSIGFAAEKLYGSVWHFTPPDGLDGENATRRGIHIHEPHPVSKMGVGKARHIGRRLERWYGLKAESFVLA